VGLRFGQKMLETPNATPRRPEIQGTGNRLFDGLGICTGFSQVGVLDKFCPKRFSRFSRATSPKSVTFDFEPVNA
jgi:hypothetical protein